MELKDYQQKALRQVDDYLKALGVSQGKKRKFAEVDPTFHYDVPTEAWKQLELKANYQPWQNGVGEDVPSICLKVPTAGGKTLLGVRAIELINLEYRRAQSGFVLWIVPSTQIYRQTLAALRNREHPYRQALDRASAGRTIILEKGDKFTPQQVQTCLLVMMLMLPSANRKDKET